MELRYHYQGSTEELSTTQNSQLFMLERSGNPGRPRFEIRQEQIHGLREALGFRWVDIARDLSQQSEDSQNSQETNSSQEETDLLNPSSR